MLSHGCLGEPVRVTAAATARDALEIIAKDRLNGAFVDAALPDLPGIDVVRRAAAHEVPAILLAKDGPERAMLAAAGLPFIVRPPQAGEIIAATRALVARSSENLSRLRTSLHRLATARMEFDAGMQVGLTHDRVVLDRLERLRKSGVSPRAARRPNLLDDWDVVRAAQHMIETHGVGAVLIAETRADQADELRIVKRWRAIAQAIREISHQRSYRQSSIAKFSGPS